MPLPPTVTDGRPVFSGGPCPGCEGRGALLILRRAADGILLFHCPTCGLTFTHVPPGAIPESGRSLEEVAPGGAEPATKAEFRRAGLDRYAILWRGGPHGWIPPEEPPPPKPLPVLHSAKPKAEGKSGLLGGAIGIFVVIKILALLLKNCGD